GYSLRLPSFLADVETRFDEDDADHYALFDVGWVLQPSERDAPVGGALVDEIAGHRLYRMAQAGGPVGVVDTQGVVTATRNTIGKAATGLLATWQRGDPLPVIGFGGEAPRAAPTLDPEAPAPGNPP